MKLIEEVLRIIHNSGLDYCIQNKYEKLPDEIPTDIDMMYKDANEEFLDNIIKRICDETGGRLVQKYVQGFYQYTYVLFYYEENGFFQIPLDFYRAMTWKGYFNVMMAEEMLDTKRLYKGFYVPDQYVELKYLWIRRTIKNDLNQEHLAVSRALVSENKNQKYARLIKDFGSDVANLIISSMDENSVDIFYENKNLFEIAVQKFSKNNKSIKNTVLNFKFQVCKVFPKRILYHCGISVAFLAPDGGGKSTIIQLLTDYIYKKNIFDGTRNYYSRPRLLKNLGHFNAINPHDEETTNDNPHGKKVNGRLKSFVRFSYYNLDYQIGTLLKIIPNKIAKKLVIFDRYYYDYFVDIKRYQYKLMPVTIRVFSYFIPKPNIVFILDASSEVLYGRKQELSIEEIDRQRKAYINNKKYMGNVRVIDVDRELDDILNDIITEIVIYQEKRTKKIIR